MIDRICGIYPTNNVYRKGMRSTWSQDDFLLSVDVDDARKVMDLVEVHGKVPSLPEIKQMLRMMWNKSATHQPIVVKCEICAESGWDTGIRLKKDPTAMYGCVVSEYVTTEEFLGNTYSVVRPCACPNGQERAQVLRTLKRS
jgi:hypothetical protein